MKRLREVQVCGTRIALFLQKPSGTENKGRLLDFWTAHRVNS